MHATRFSCSIHARRYPLSYVYSGYYYWGDGYLYYQGSYGGWWSTTATSDSSAYNLGMASSYLDPQLNSSKAGGVSLRCTFCFTFSRRYPLSYVFSGVYYWGGGNLAYQDSVGAWWSTTASSASNAYHLNMNSSNLDPQGNNTKASGFALR
ncbi:hypothetical protein IK112_01220, partial [Candidatus Saccharibacteria bacterium]|nr:hypothetical protein [Candidatus Saccharibacteria bacterium]